jgi:DNA-binding GntR family transcriptional regulator
MLIKSELAVALPRKGIMVRPISVRDVRELFEMRRIIEAAAIRKSAPLLTASDLSTARTLISAQAQVDPAKDFAGLLAADERFHCLLWSRCGNQEMEAALSRVWNRIKLLRAQARGLPEWQKTSVQHHEQILAAIESRRFDHAVSLVTGGITRSEEELVGVIERATTPAR